MPEPIGVAFVEVLPDPASLARFNAQTNAAIARGGGVAGSAGTKRAARDTKALAAAEGEAAAAGKALTDQEIRQIAAANGVAAAETDATRATKAHARASLEAREAVLAETASFTGLRGASIGVNPTFLLATAAAIGFFKSAEEADKFKEQMHLIQFATQANEEEMQRAAKVAHAYGDALDIPATSAVTAAEAIKELTNSGQSLNDALIDSRDLLLLNVATQGDMASSTKDLVQLLNAYHLGVGEASDVTDSLVAAQKSGAGSTDEWAGALKTAAPIAAGLGLDIRQTTALLIEFSKAGVPASQTGSLFVRAVSRLLSGAPAVNKELKALGVNLRNADGSLRPDAFIRLGEAVQKLPPQLQSVAVSQLFGTRAGLRLLPVLLQERDSFIKSAQAANEHGLAQREAEDRAKSLGGQTKELKSNLSDLGVELGKVTDGPLTGLVSLLAGSAKTFTTFIRDVEQVGHVIGHAIPPVPSQLKEFVGILGKVEKFSFGGPFLAGARVFHAGWSLIHHDSDQGAEDAKKLKTEVEGNLSDLATFMANWGKDLLKGDTPGKAVSESLQTKLAVAQATGTDQDQLNLLEQIRTKQAAHLKRVQRRLDSGRGSNTAVQNAANALKSTDSAIDSILTQRKTDAESARSKAKSAADAAATAAAERERAFVAGIGNVESRKQEALSVAQATEGLGDDINKSKRLRDFYARTIQEIRKRIKSEHLTGDALKVEREELRALGRSYRDTKRSIQQLRKDQRTAEAEEGVQSAQLDLQLLQTQAGDDPTRKQINAQIRAHERVIAALKKQQATVKKGTNAYKELRNEIAQERAAIRDLRKEQAKRNDDIGQQQFAFLQTTTGFAQQLAGNTLRADAQVNLVGPASPQVPGPMSPPRRAAQGAVALRAAAGTQPPKAAQLDTQIVLMRRTVQLLERIASGNSNGPSRFAKESAVRSIEVRGD